MFIKSEKKDDLTIPSSLTGYNLAPGGAGRGDFVILYKENDDIYF